ncbi:hypothetical protein [Allohahella sp. A8]|uniref:hypothetical protein n=1 Tax=Allohahella sp. A8 TaxID=3141461 RepID=UPI003A80E4B7
MIAQLKRAWAWLNPKRPPSKWDNIETDAELIRLIHKAHAEQNWELHEELCDELEERDLWSRPL